MAKIANPFGVVNEEKDTAEVKARRTFPMSSRDAYYFATDPMEAKALALKDWKGNETDETEFLYEIEVNTYADPNFQQEPFIPGGTVTKAEHDRVRQVKLAKYAWRITIADVQNDTLYPRKKKGEGKA